MSVEATVQSLMVNIWSRIGISLVVLMAAFMAFWMWCSQPHTPRPLFHVWSTERGPEWRLYSAMTDRDGTWVLWDVPNEFVVIVSRWGRNVEMGCSADSLYIKANGIEKTVPLTRNAIVFVDRFGASTTYQVAAAPLGSACDFMIHKTLWQGHLFERVVMLAPPSIAEDLCALREEDE